MLERMKLTVRLDSNLLAEARKHAAESGRTLSLLLEEALRESLARRRLHANPKRVRLNTVNGGGLRAGVALDDGAALLNLMDASS